MSGETCKTETVDLQSNGIVRKNGVIIGRLCKHPDDIKSQLDQLVYEYNELRDQYNDLQDENLALKIKSKKVVKALKHALHIGDSRSCDRPFLRETLKELGEL